MSLLIQKLRLQRGWSQQQLADLSGLSVRTVQRIESGQKATAESLKSLAAVFEVEFQELRAAVECDEPSAAAPPAVPPPATIDPEPKTMESPAHPLQARLGGVVAGGRRRCLRRAGDAARVVGHRHRHGRCDRSDGARAART
jgi:transcriptional regulator with XRE-family HTH domain